MGAAQDISYDSAARLWQEERTGTIPNFNCRSALALAAQGTWRGKRQEEEDLGSAGHEGIKADKPTWWGTLPAAHFRGPTEYSRLKPSPDSLWGLSRGLAFRTVSGDHLEGPVLPSVFRGGVSQPVRRQRGVPWGSDFILGPAAFCRLR